MGNTIFSASDLSRKRKDILREARDGVALVRDTDGVGLVMMQESRLRFLERMQELTGLHVVVGRVVSKGAGVSIQELGSNSWIRVFDEGDLVELSAELGDALQAARGDENTDLADEVVKAWRVTARQLQDPLRREVLTSSLEQSDFAEAPRPSGE